MELLRGEGIDRKEDNPLSETPNEADRIEIVYYTDPLCCWSWAFEPHWQQLLSNFEHKVSWKYCMGGLVPDWESYNDPINSISRPAQMGPLWMEVHHSTGIPINYHIWIKNPPKSSYPACIAVKTAELQSAEAGELYLRKVREAVMIHSLDISKAAVLHKIAMQLSINYPGRFNADQFLEDFDSEKSRDAFRQDLQRIRYNQIGRFPTLTMKKGNQPGIIITGYRPYEVLLQALSRIDPQLTDKDL